MLDAIWNRGDISVLDTSVAEDHAGHAPGGDEIGRDLLAQGIMEYRAAFPHLSHEPGHLPADPLVLIPPGSQLGGEIVIYASPGPVRGGSKCPFGAWSGLLPSRRRPPSSPRPGSARGPHTTAPAPS